ncbi:hypothetical protein SSPS47_29340 [Streptomyces sp. S4.7]|uniref:class I SAM-dependent methyltransferase n=1 Tax=Streptomyces sp. S4.7 TaxID=2705439 RepID=UPI0013970A54|nr:class I SAM-dependent methyltransferase [Streptomyces sp. S4.7]QHY99214.1 hypothetical protein SSPS47_29340 [Streptomyces sp. S4.7]
MAKSSDVGELWDAESFDALRRQLIPSFDLLYDCAADVVASGRTADGERVQVLDLGAGTGLLSAAVQKRVPDCDLVLLDLSSKMLRKTEHRFTKDATVQLVTADMAEDALPEGPFDAVISALAIHHLPHDGKRKLFSRILEVLRPGGVFVNVDQVVAPSARVEELYDRRHEEHVRLSQTPPQEWAAGRERMKYDICADTESQLGWLRECGFVDVDCLAKDCRFVTFAGWKDSGGAEAVTR